MLALNQATSLPTSHPLQTMISVGSFQDSNTCGYFVFIGSPERDS